MATNTAGSVARELPTQQTHYLRKTINYNDAGLSTGVKFGAKLPAGAEVLSTVVKIKTAFNNSSTNVLTVGQNSTSFNDFVASGDVDEATIAATTVLRGGDVDIAADTDVFIKFTSTGSGISAGKAVVIISYVPNNDD